MILNHQHINTNGFAITYDIIVIGNLLELKVVALYHITRGKPGPCPGLLPLPCEG